MLHFFRRLLAKGAHQKSSPGPEAAFERLKEVAPLKSEVERHVLSGVETVGHSFVCREAVLGRQERVAGYEFTLPESIQSRLQGKRELVQRVYDDALLRNLASMGVHSLLGHRLAFVGLAPSSLANPLLQHLPSDNTVLLLSPTQEDFDSDEVSARLDVLRQGGFSHGWIIRRSQLEQHSRLQGLAAEADYVQIATGGFDGVELTSLRKSLTHEREKGRAPIRLIASELNSVDEFSLCFQAQFDYFLGQFVSSRDNWHPPKSEINRLRIIELLNLVRGGAEFDVISEQLKREPVLTFKLLRYINSPVMGLQSQISTMDKALIILGREKFYRWLSLLLFDIKTPGYRDRVLAEQALSRARCLENLAGIGRIPPQKDALFLLGLFSLLDLLLGRPMTEVLAQANLPEPVHDALLGKAGVFQDALLLAVAIEGLDHAVLAKRVETCGVSAQDVSRSAVEALSWASGVADLAER